MRTSPSSAAPAGRASTCRTAAEDSRPRGTKMYLTSVQRCADLNRGFSLANAPTTRRQTRAPLFPHMDLESCVYAVSGFFVLGDRTRRGCCARSIIPGPVRSARGVDRVARSLDRASPAGFHAQPHRPTGRVLTHSPRGQTSHPRVFHGPFTSNRGFGDSR